MYKKITGVDEDLCRENMIEAKNNYAQYMTTLVEVKGLDKVRKHDNNLERAEMRK